MKLIAGVDGCPGGWVAVIEDQVTNKFSVEVFESAGRLLTSGVELFAIDIPIGLPDSYSRKADKQARDFLSPKRHNSVFPAPLRAALRMSTRSEASELSRSLIGKGVGAQAFGIYPKIREVDDALLTDVKMRKYVFEIHPEVSFSALNGCMPLIHPKRTLEGQQARLALLFSEFPAGLYDTLRRSLPKKLVADDDILDALAALWTCRRIASGLAVSLPEPPEVDSAGISAAIWY